MSRLDDELRNALRREEPSAGFAERVLARVEHQPVTRRWWIWPQLRWAGVAAAAVLLVGGVEIEHARRIRAEGELAKRQVMLALQITGNKLELVKEKVYAIDSTQH